MTGCAVYDCTVLYSGIIVPTFVAACHRKDGSMNNHSNTDKSTSEVIHRGMSHPVDNNNEPSSTRDRGDCAHKRASFSVCASQRQQVPTGLDDWKLSFHFQRHSGRLYVFLWPSTRRHGVDASRRAGCIWDVDSVCAYIVIYCLSLFDPLWISI